jgi:hypothetical protein
VDEYSVSNSRIKGEAAMTRKKVMVPMTIPYLLMFLLLTFLCMEAHETFHHLVGGVLCGGFGRMTLTIYEPACDLYIITFAGPFLSFAIAWVSGYLLLKNKRPLFAYTLLFASFAHLRFPLPLMHNGDEWSVLGDYLPSAGRYWLAGILFLLALSPVVIAFRSIANRRRVLIFAISWLLPLSLLFVLPYIDTWLFGPDLDKTSLSLVGIPVVILVVNLIAIGLYVFTQAKVFGQLRASEVRNEQVLLS